MSHRLSRSFAAGSAVALVVVLTQLMPAAASTPREPQARGGGKHNGALVVRLRAGVSDATAAALFSRSGAAEVGRIDRLDTRVVVAKANPASVRRVLADSPLVTAVEDDGVAQVALTPTDPLWSNEWYARKVRGPRAWDKTVGAGGPVVAVLDTGVQANHPDLAGRVLAGWDFVNNDPYASDDNGHGTAVAGIVAGAGMNDLGIAGMCWQCRILPVKVANINGNILWSNVAAGITWAADHGARVINMSFGSFTSSTTVADAVTYARSKGAVVIGAAGNNGSYSRFYPAAHPGVISVAATTSSDTLYTWSNRGSWVDMAAPGCTWTTARGSTWRSFCGTSASAPIVAGAAGLVMSAYPTVGRWFVENALLSTDVRVTSAIGGGRLDAAAAVGASTPSTDSEPVSDPTRPSYVGACPNQDTSGSDGDMEWHGSLSGLPYGVSCSVKLGGYTRFEAAWKAPAGLTVSLVNSTGSVVARLGGSGEGSDRLERRLTREVYRVVVRPTADGDAWFDVRLSWRNRAGDN